MTKINWYATVNRSKNNKAGTKIRLSHRKHPQLLKFLFSRWEDLYSLSETNPTAMPSFQLSEKNWDIIAGELRIKNQGDQFTKIYYRSQEVCIISHNKYRAEIMNTELIREEAERQRKLKEKQEEE